MTSLPIRHWLLLALVALIALPTLATTMVAALEQRHLEESPLPDATVQREVTTNVARWDDPAWQAAIEPQLTAAGTDVVLLDGAGRELFRTATDPLGYAAEAPAMVAGPGGDVVAARVPSRLVSKLVVSDDAQPLGTAYLYQSPLPFTADFGRQWLLPLTQVVTFLVVAAVAAWFVNGALLRPLAAMGRAAHDIAAGNLDFRLPPSRVWEVAEVAAAFGAMGAALRTSLERQAELEQERRLFVGALVHDLRTPLFALRGYLEGLATGLADAPEKRARYVAVCRDKAAALERLIADLFAYTRTEYLEQTPHAEPLELGELLARIVEGLRPQAEAKGVRLELDGLDEPCPFAGDPHLLTRAVENLLDNAVRHTPPGGRVRVGWRRSADGLTFTIDDTGPGIPAPDLHRIFTPLYRGETSRNRRTGGAGLGLAIAKRIMRAHGGDLAAANGAGGGARFTGVLPIPSSTVGMPRGASGATDRSPIPVTIGSHPV